MRHPKRSRGARRDGFRAVARGIALLLPFLGPAEPAAAGEGELLLDIRDAATEEPVRDLKCGLVRAASSEVYARFEGARYGGDPPPRAGDSLYVYRRGYDLLHLTIEEGVGRIAGSLVPCSESTTLVVEGEGAADLDVQVTVHLRLPDYLRSGPILDQYDVSTRGSGLEIPMPRGMTVSPYVVPARGILWPVFVPAARGRPHVVRWDPPRTVEVLFDEDRGRGHILSMECLEDHAWVPGVEPLRVDAWRGSFRARWTEGEKPALEVVPPVPFHCLLRFQDVFAYRYVGARDTVVDFRRLLGPKRVSGRPIVDGRPVPKGTILLPGRLDPCAVAILASSGVPWAHRAVPETDAWPDVVLAAADTLTAWHRDLGLAHLEWAGDRPPVGKTYPGLVLVTVPSGFAAEGNVSVYPVWKGTGRVRSMVPDDVLRQSFDGAARLRFPGLRPGRYSLNISVELRAGEGGERYPVREVREIDVPEEHPTVVHRLEPR